MQTRNYGWFGALLNVWVVAAVNPCVAAEDSSIVEQGRTLFNATGLL